MTDRRTGAVGLHVDLLGDPQRRVAQVGLMVDFNLVVLTPSAGAVTQSQSVSLQTVYTPGGVRLTVSTTQEVRVSSLRALISSRTLTATQSEAVTLQRAASLTRVTATVAQTATGSYHRIVAATRTITQSQSLSVLAAKVVLRTLTTSQASSASVRMLPQLVRVATQAQSPKLAQAVSRTLRIAEPTVVSVVEQVRMLRLATQAETVARLLNRVYRLTVAATQSQVAVRIPRQFKILVQIDKQRRVGQRVTIRRVLGRSLRVSSTQQPRLVRQLRLTRTVTQAQSVSMSGLPVKLTVVSVVQARSLALFSQLGMARSVVQAQVVALAHNLNLGVGLQQRTRLERVQAVTLMRVAQPQAQAVSLSSRNVTPFYQVLLSTTQGQHVALTSAPTGKSAKQFIVSMRDTAFTPAGRKGQFVTGSRGTRFIVEERV